MKRTVATVLLVTSGLLGFAAPEAAAAAPTGHVLTVASNAFPLPQDEQGNPTASCGPRNDGEIGTTEAYGLVITWKCDLAHLTPVGEPVRFMWRSIDVFPGDD